MKQDPVATAAITPFLHAGEPLLWSGRPNQRMGWVTWLFVFVLLLMGAFYVTPFILIGAGLFLAAVSGVEVLLQGWRLVPDLLRECWLVPKLRYGITPTGLF